MFESKFIKLYNLIMEHLDYSTPPGKVDNSKFYIGYSNKKIYQKYDERNI